MGWKASDIPDQSGKVAVVTGGNGGLGLETSRQLAVHGALVVIGARNLEKAEAARKQIEASVPGARLELRQLDLGSLDSIAYDTPDQERISFILEQEWAWFSGWQPAADW